MLNRYSDSDDWNKMRFSDELMHFDSKTIEKIHSIRKPDQRYCQDCIQEKHQSNEKDRKRHHC